MRHLPIVPDGWVYIGVLGIVCLLTYFWRPWFTIIPLILLIFIAFFFRNPERTVPAAPGLIVSPADGVVINVDRVYEGDYLKTEAQRVSIFLSIFNVHINRAPMDGKIEYLSYRRGKFLPAWKSEVSDENEQNRIGLNNGGCKVMVNQIAGLVARRVVCWSQTGDELKRGERFGLIKFGSCTELYLPLEVELTVNRGDRVKGGETVIGRVK